jgi:hypothetical protein
MLMRAACCWLIVLSCCGVARADDPPTTRPDPLTEKAALDFVLNNLPEPDVGSVLSEQTVANVRVAMQTRARVPWGEDLCDEAFLNGVLPYYNLTEPRDEWRAEFSQRFAPLVKNCQTPSQAALAINEGISKLIKLKLPPKDRAKADPSPYETIRAGYASSSGLAILVVDICRSVGVPARVVGTPSISNPKKDQPPFHFWVEIWDGQWFVLSPGENKPLNQGWFMENCARANPNDPQQRIYDASYKRTGTPFPLAWDESAKNVWAEDVSYSYVKRIPVRLQVMDREDGTRIYGHLNVRLNDRLIADALVAEPITVFVSAGQTYDAVVRAIPGPIKRPRVFTAPNERGWLLSLPVGD